MFLFTVNNCSFSKKTPKLTIKNKTAKDNTLCGNEAKKSKFMEEWKNRRKEKLYNILNSPNNSRTDSAPTTCVVHELGALIIFT